MSQFIILDDYDASIHRDILDGITRSDEGIVEICEDRAIMEMKGYLKKRYDVEKLFKARGRARNQLVLMKAIDIAVYHLFTVHNPRNMSELRKDRWKAAIEWLKEVRDGEQDIDGAPELTDEEKRQTSPFVLSSNPKRTNHF